MNDKPVIIFADDEEHLHPLGRAYLQRARPDAQVIICGDPKSCEDNLRKYGSRVIAVVLDAGLHPNSYEGAKIAESIRKGSYGEALRQIPVALFSGDSTYVKAEPPITLISKGNPTAWTEIIDFAQNVKPEKEPSQEELAQQVRDHSAQMLLNYLPKSPDYHDQDSEYMVKFGYQGRTIKENQNFAQDRCEMMRHYFEAAFEGAGPSVELTRRISKAVERDQPFYIPNDDEAMRYSRLRQLIREAVRRQLREHGDEEERSR